MRRRIFGHKRGEVMGGQRKLHNERLHSLFSPPNMKMIKSRRMHGEYETAELWPDSLNGRNQKTWV
jgi:hypothetical protein